MTTNADLVVSFNEAMARISDQAVEIIQLRAERAALLAEQAALSHDSELWKQACRVAGVDHTVEHHVAMAAVATRIKAFEARPLLDIMALQRLASVLGYETGDILPSLKVMVDQVARYYEQRRSGS